MESTALVFDIEKFATHDGPGIRTVVFLKGCPLRCIWCHNPESWEARHELLFRADKCVQCGVCAQLCPKGVHTLSGSHQLDRSRCAGCGKCADSCPTEALELCGREQSAEEVFSEVLKDRAFYENSGGGLTLSGGEPMAHFNFTRALLEMAHEAQIHTALETCGFAPQSCYQEILPFTDLFLFDIKTLNPEKHRRFTGQDNALILKNLHFLNDNGAQIILRCPLIPTLNDSAEELQRIGELAESLSGVAEIDVEPYHPLGVGKGEQLGCKKVWNAPFASKEFTASAIAAIAGHTGKIVKKS